MTNQEFIHCFETDNLPEDSFHHADHVRLAFAYFPSTRFCKLSTGLPAP
jgi:hypothetical protein